MPIFYILQNMLPSAKDSGKTFGQRNVTVFLAGMFLYVVLWVVLKNMSLSGKITDKVFDTINVAFCVLFLSDAFVTGWIYKDFYGRTILSEVGENFGDGNKNYDYDEKTHKYTKKKSKKHTSNTNIKKINIKEKNDGVLVPVEKLLEGNKKTKDSDSETTSDGSKDTIKSIKSIKSKSTKSIGSSNWSKLVSENNDDDSDSTNLSKISKSTKSSTNIDKIAE